MDTCIVNFTYIRVGECDDAFISHVDLTGIDATGRIITQEWKFEYPTGTTHVYANKPTTPSTKVANFFNVVQHMKIRETLAMFSLIITKNPTDVNIVNGFLAGLDDEELSEKKTTCVYCDAGPQTLTKDVVESLSGWRTNASDDNSAPVKPPSRTPSSADWCYDDETASSSSSNQPAAPKKRVVASRERVVKALNEMEVKAMADEVASSLAGSSISEPEHSERPGPLQTLHHVVCICVHGRVTNFVDLADAC